VRGGDHVPADGVGAVFVDHLKRVDDVADVLGHFFALFVDDEFDNDAIFEAGLVVKHGRDGQK